MPIRQRLFNDWRNLINRQQVAQELTEELRTFQELLIAEKIKQGFSPQEAERAVRIEIGSTVQIKENVRETRLGHYLEAFWQDLRFAR